MIHLPHLPSTDFVLEFSTRYLQARKRSNPSWFAKKTQNIVLDLAPGQTISPALLSLLTMGTYANAMALDARGECNKPYFAFLYRERDEGEHNLAISTIADETTITTMISSAPPFKDEDPDLWEGFATKAWAHFVKNFKNKGCAVCGKSGHLRACSLCKCTFYCGHECQKTDWKTTHKHTCCESVTFMFRDVNGGLCQCNGPPV